MALRDSGLFVLLAVSTAALISGCVPYYEDYQWIERSDQYIAPAVLAEIWQRHLTRSEVIGRVGPIYPDDQTDRAIGYFCAARCRAFRMHGTGEPASGTVRWSACGSTKLATQSRSSPC